MGSKHYKIECMKTKDMGRLKKYDKVTHKKYGESCVMNVIRDFGPVILPLTREGLLLLSKDSGTTAGTPFLASDYKQNLSMSTIK